MTDLLLAALVAFNSGAAGMENFVSESVPSVTALSSPADTGEESFAWGSYEGPEGKRRYKLFVPSNAPARNRPLIVMLHGCTQDPEDFARGTRMNEVAGKQGFVVLYPEQPATANPLKCWNWFAGAHQKRGEGEPAILAAMIRRVIATKKIDPAKVYLAGISAGGAMTAILGATHPELFSALAVHSGIAYSLVTEMSQAIVAMRAPKGDASALGGLVSAAMGQRKKILPMMVVHGTADASVTQENASVLTSQWLAAHAHPGTSGQTKRVTVDGRHPVSRTTHAMINGKVIVDKWMVEGLGHAWSGGSSAGTYTDEGGPDMTSEVVRFFLDSEKPKR